jgi:hypothetical protein
MLSFEADRKILQKKEIPLQLLESPVLVTLDNQFMRSHSQGVMLFNVVPQLPPVLPYLG